MSYSLTSSCNAPRKGLRDFIVDNAAPCGYISTQREHFTNYKPVTDSSSIGGIASDRVKIEGRGDIRLKTAAGRELVLKDAAYVPKSIANIFSVRKAMKALGGSGQYVEGERTAKITFDGEVLATATDRKGFLYLDLHHEQDFR